MDEVFAAYMRGGLALPAPSKARKGEHAVSPPAETMAKAALYVAMKDAGISKVQLAKRLGIDEKEVRRLLDPHYGSKLPRIAEAIEALGQRLVIGLEGCLTESRALGVLGRFSLVCRWRLVVSTLIAATLLPAHATEASPALPASAPIVVPLVYIVHPAATVFFDLYSAVLTPVQRDRLDRVFPIAAQMSDVPACVRIQGHADKPEASVLDASLLSEARAKAVADIVRAAGYPRMKVTWKGASLPVLMPPDQRNARVEVEFLPCRLVQQAPASSVAQ